MTAFSLLVQTSLSSVAQARPPRAPQVPSPDQIYDLPNDYDFDKSHGEPGAAGEDFYESLEVTNREGGNLDYESLEITEYDAKLHDQADYFTANEQSIKLEVIEMNAKLEDYLDSVEPALRRKEFLKRIGAKKIDGGYTQTMRDYVEAKVLDLGREKLVDLIKHGGVDENGHTDPLAKKISLNVKDEDMKEVLRAVRAGEWDSHRKVKKWILREGAEAIEPLVLSGKDLNIEHWAQAIGKTTLMDTINRGDTEGLKLETVNGPVEATQIDGLYVPRAFHKKSGIMWLTVPAEFDFNSKHWKKFKARIRAFARTSGTPVMTLQIDGRVKGGGRIIDFQDTPKTRAQKLRNFIDAINEGVAKGWSHYIMGSIFAAVGAGISVGVSLADAALKGHAVDLTPAAVGAGMTVALMAFTNSVKNVTNLPESLATRLTAGSILSFVYVYLVKYFQGGDAWAQLTVADLSGLLAHGTVALTVLPKKLTSDSWADIIRTRENKGRSRGKIWGFKRSLFEHYSIGVIKDIPPQADLIGLSVPTPVFGHVPLGKFLNYTGFLYMKLLAWRYAKRLKSENADRLKRELIDLATAGPIRRVPFRFARWMKDLFMGLAGEKTLPPPKTCVLALSPRSLESWEYDTFPQPYKDTLKKP